MRNSKPLIVVSPSTQQRGVEFSDLSVNVSEAYLRAVLSAGGLPTVLSCTPSADYIAECVETCDGVMLTGGDDLQPELYSRGLEPRLRATVGETVPARDLFELMLIGEVFRQRKPLLAICRGHQILNVAFGGTLLVDISSQRPGALAHRQMQKKSQPVHQVKLAAGSVLAGVFGESVIEVNSTHHQAVDRLAAPFHAVARSPDGIIEAMELTPAKKPLAPWLVSVQFHPERLFPGYPGFLNLFEAFVKACAR